LGGQNTVSTLYPPAGWQLAPGPHKAFREFGNPAPLGLSAFALTTFVLSLVNVQARGVTTPNVVVGLAYFYGGVVQFAAGMWEFACGNTFGATALSSYGGFWLSYAAIQTNAFGIATAYAKPADLASAVGFFLICWFIFTFLLVLCTLRSTLAFFFLFFTLDMAFLFLAIGEFETANGNISRATGCSKAGGWFGLLAALAAWYNALAGLLDSNNSFFLVPVVHFPWSKRGRAGRHAAEEDKTE